MTLKIVKLCLVAALAGFSAPASAVVIDLAPSNFSFGPSYSQDGYTFTNGNAVSGSYANWIPGGFPAFNASNANGDIVQVGAATSNTITNDASQAFSFSSIGLANVYNNGGGGDVLFTFNHVGGGVNSATVSLLSGVLGLQTFLFNETGLTSVVFTPLTTEGPYLQFDNIDVNVSAVPEPSTWAMMMLGFAGFGHMAYRRRRMAVPAVLAAIVAAGFAGHAEAATKKQKKPPSEAATQSQQQPKPATNTYGPSCKNQGASIMSGGCVNFRRTASVRVAQPRTERVSPAPRNNQAAKYYS
nr:PEP-CTERM sorting domain-containing protein [Bradyrhizobium sp. sGM-13]